MDQKTNLTIPGAIIVAGLLVAGAVFFTRDGSSGTTAAVNNAVPTPADIVIKPITDADHIIGNPDADIIVVEYSDTECPFCKNFQGTMKQIMAEYGKGGKVAWVYRHFPLVQLHSKAPKEAEATECAAFLGGKSKFWDYIDAVFAATPSNDGLDPAELPKIAVNLGLNKKDFEACLSSGKFTKAIDQSYQDSLAAGGRGTPYSVIVTKSGEKMPIDGAQPYANMKSIIDNLLKGK